LQKSENGDKIQLYVPRSQKGAPNTTPNFNFFNTFMVMGILKHFKIFTDFLNGCYRSLQIEYLSDISKPQILQKSVNVHQWFSNVSGSWRWTILLCWHFV